jgi:hypothetical protein
MSEKSKAAWQAILAKRRKETVSDAGNTANIEQPQVTKRGSNCGTEGCCMRQNRANVTYEGPTILSGMGYDLGGFVFKGIEPPMLCSGANWTARESTRWEKRRDEAKQAPGLAEFRKKK